MPGGLSSFSLFKQTMGQDSGLHLLSSEEVQSIQKILLAILDDIHAVCRSNDLEYVLFGGGALGAERHGGFIPWDDDLDICMPRKDYDRFRQCMLDAFPNRYYIQEILSCEKYDLNFMKVRLIDSEFCELLEAEPERAGIFIDIFAIENVIDNRFGMAFQWLFSDGMQFICSCVRIRKKKNLLLKTARQSGKAARLIRIKATIAIPFCLIPFRKWLLWTDRILAMCKNEQSKLVSVPTGVRHFRGECYPREWIFPAQETSFQGRSYYIMAENKTYLKKRYGDYQSIPPESKRERHSVVAFRLPSKSENS